MDRTEALKRKYYPDDSRNGTAIFYGWLRQYARGDSMALNIGAGGHPFVMTEFAWMRGRVKRVIGVDLSASILNNPCLDQALLADASRLPFGENTFDLIWADYVLEHIREPLGFLKEVARVLKRGASFFFRTPNKYHYVSLIARLTPYGLHQLIGNRAQRLPSQEVERFPTHYLLNSRKEILAAGSSAGFRGAEIKLIETEPTYLQFHPIAFRLGVAYERTVNRCRSLCDLRANILGRLEKG